MAQPIAFTRPVSDVHGESRKRLERAPEDHAEALLAGYEVLQGLYDRGVLELLRGALDSADRVVEIAVDSAKSPQSVRSLRNLLLLVNLIGDLSPEQLKQITRAAPAVLDSTWNARPPGLWRLLLAALWDQDLRRGLWIGLSLLSAIGHRVR